MAVSSRFVPAPDHVGVRRALVSVFDKDGLFELGEALARRNVEIVSTGGSARALAQADVPVTDVSAVTRFPEIMDGRVKTLHPAIHGGLLGIRGEAGHGGEMSEHGIEAIDLLIVNLYPFETVRREGADYPTSVENIDIGGPAMIRAAAKNHAYVAVVTDPDDYPALIGELDAHDGAISYAFRQRLAAKAFARTAAYDAAIAGWFEDTLTPDEEAAPPRHRTIGGSLRQAMRYGENPHQAAGFYTTGDTRPGVATARQLQGKQLSYNNINDTDAAFECVAEFDPSESPACVIVKHANPCGAALGTSVLDAYEKALACDPVSAFGGIVALNRPLDADAARKIVEIFTEVIIAPDASPEAIGIVAGKKNLRLLLTDGLPDPHAPGLAAKTVAGGVLVQSRDTGAVEASSLKTVTTRAPEAGEEADLVFAFRIAKHVKSNAIVYVKDRATVGIGAGQMSRVDAAAIAARKAEDAARAMGLDRPLTRGSVVASDAFFPFADGLLSAIEAGATAVIQPGGSVRDDEVIAAADEAGVAMVFTGMRHFRH